MTRDDILSLADGRVLAFTAIGAADGAVVVYHHGAPGAGSNCSHSTTPSEQRASAS